MKTFLFLAISSFLFFQSSVTLGCNRHPGITHEQWTSAIKDERTKTGAIETFSKDFFQKSPERDGASQKQDSNSDRPVRRIQ